MNTLSLRQAAAEAGVSKSTIWRAIEKGRLSAGRTNDGGFAIQPAELFRLSTQIRERCKQWCRNLHRLLLAPVSQSTLRRAHELPRIIAKVLKLDLRRQLAGPRAG